VKSIWVDVLMLISDGPVINICGPSFEFRIRTLEAKFGHAVVEELNDPSETEILVKPKIRGIKITVYMVGDKELKSDKKPSGALIWLVEVNSVVGSDNVKVIVVGTLKQILGSPAIVTVKLLLRFVFCIRSLEAELGHPVVEELKDPAETATEVMGRVSGVNITL
jgi:hypothetical protein